MAQGGRCRAGAGPHQQLPAPHREGPRAADQPDDHGPGRVRDQRRDAARALLGEQRAVAAVRRQRLPGRRAQRRHGRGRGARCHHRRPRRRRTGPGVHGLAGPALQAVTDGPVVRRIVGGLLAAAFALGALAGSAAGAAPEPSFDPERSVYDPDGILGPATVRTAESVSRAVSRAVGIPLILVARRAPDRQPATATAAHALAVGTALGLSRGLVFALDVEASTCAGQGVFVRFGDVSARELSDAVLEEIVSERVRPVLAACDPDTALIVAVNAISGPLLRAGAALPASSVAPGASAAASRAPAATPQPGGAGASVPAGPPFPEPEDGRYVYDYAGVFGADTLATVQGQIEAIRERTGAEIAVYSQVVEYGITTEEAERHARALMDQWGVGRRGFDDGLVILFDLDPSLVHGQVQLYAGPGFRATFLSNSERQAIFDNDMLPLLRVEDLDGALLIAMARINEKATPEHAATLARARTVNALIGLVGTPLAFALLVGWAALSWVRYGRDPYYLDDPSILMPAPPPDLTAAAGALVMDGASSRHTLTTAMLDLASRDEIAFRPEVRRFARDRLKIEIRKPDTRDPRIGLNRRKPISPAETYALERLAALAESQDGVRIVEPDDLLKFGEHVSTFDDRLEA
ncbi:MAG: DUF2207 domain-containing protein, partial [Chloroflexi bacterium]|nr:DUF2207 domain-containing protein [Chloroflexota bacterium]